MDRQHYKIKPSLPDCLVPVNESQLFTRHSDSVLCCSIAKNNRLIVSGGVDDTAFVWDLETKHAIFECTGHKESVVAAAFSVKSTYVATGDMNGYIQVRNTANGMKIFEFDIDEINWIRWHNSSDFVLLAGTMKGDFWMWNVNDPIGVKTFPSYGHASITAEIFDDGKEIAVAYKDGSLRVFDLKLRKMTRQLEVEDKSEITCLDINPNNSLLAIGCMDSSVKIMTTGGLKVISNFVCKTREQSKLEDPQKGSFEVIEVDDSSDEEPPPEASSCEDIPSEESDDDDMWEYQSITECLSVESVLFSPCGEYLAAAENTGNLVMWDVPHGAVRCQIDTERGITRCTWLPSGHYVVGFSYGSVRVYDINLNMIHQIEAHMDKILDVANASMTILTVSDDKTCRAVDLSA